VGQWRFKHASGVERAEGDFLNGKPDGEWKFWRAFSGSSKPEPDEGDSGVYRAVRIEGADGRVRSEGLTLDGEAHGPWLFTWEDGSTMLEASFDRGANAGQWRFHHPGGVFDPDFVTRRFQDGLDLPGFTAPIVLPDDPIDARSAELDTQRIAIDPALLSAPDPGVDEATRAQLSHAIERGISSTSDPEIDAVRIVLSLQPRAAFALAIDRLRRVDTADVGAMRSASTFVARVVEPLIAGRSIGWSAGVDNQARVRNRLALLRAVAFHRLTRARPLLWELELRFAPEPGHDSFLQPMLGHHALVAATEVLASATRLDQLPTAPPQARPEVGRAIADGVDWLVRHQSKDGSWDADGFMALDPEGAPLCDGAGSRTRNLAVTSLALLALMGAGHDLDDGRHQENVVRGVRWLLQRQEPQSGWLDFNDVDVSEEGIFVHRPFHPIYEHLLGTLALCTALEGAESRPVRAAAVRAVEQIEHSRNPYYAWRYEALPNGENDTSVTGWAVLALEAAQDAGIEFSKETFHGALTWIDDVTDPATGRAGYTERFQLSNRYEQNELWPRELGETLTAAAIVTRLIAQDAVAVTVNQSEIVKRGATLLMQKMPEWQSPGRTVDVYYWCWGTRALARFAAVDAAAWSKWRKALEKALVPNQRVEPASAAGSWDPIGPWDWEGGRVFSTALALLCLQEEIATRPK